MDAGTGFFCVEGSVAAEASSAVEGSVGVGGSVAGVDSDSGLDAGASPDIKLDEIGADTDSVTIGSLSSKAFSRTLISSWVRSSYIKLINGVFSNLLIE